MNGSGVLQLRERAVFGPVGNERLFTTSCRCTASAIQTPTHQDTARTAHTPPTHLRGLDLQGQSPVVVLNGALGQILQAAGQAGQQGEAGAGQGWKQACPGVVACVQREGWAHTQATAKTRALAQACARGSEGTNKLYTSKLSGSASACLLDPGVLEDLRDGDALRGVGHQDLLDQVAALSGD